VPAPLTFSGAARKVTGEPGTWDVTGDGGTVKRRAFCPTCGAQLYITFPAMPELVAVHEGGPDDPGRYRPQIVTWHAAANAWDHLDPAPPKFEQMPQG
jgi:hypothetical protein